MLCGVGGEPSTIRPVSIRPVAVALAAAGALVVSAPAFGFTPAQNAAFAKKLAPEVEKVFKKEAPDLVLGKVTCVLPQAGVTVHCKAAFSDAKANANIVYLINATLQDSGAVKWVTTTHSCTDAKTGKKLKC
jgi:hypothetical protein